MGGDAEVPPGRCLILGGPKVGKRTLAAQITGGTPAPAEGPAALSWSISTKYYDAQAVVEVRRLDAAADVQLSRGGGGGYEAVVLVFDAERSFAATRAWWEARADGADGADGVEVKLAVASLRRGGAGAGAGGGEPPAWLAAARRWCGDQMVELVEWWGPGAAGEAEQAVEGAAEGAVAARRERAGAARVAEALQAHVWPGLRMKPPPARGAGARGGGDAGGGAGGGHEYQPVDVAGFFEGADAAGLLGGGADVAVLLSDPLERALRRVEAVRARAERGGLTDAQRRAAADEALGELLGALGMEGDGGGSDGGSSDGSEAAAEGAAAG